jgi:hypothetical protein
MYISWRMQISEVSLQSERALRGKAESATRDAQLENEKLRLQIQNMMHTPSAEFEAMVRLASYYSISFFFLASNARA